MTMEPEFFFYPQALRSRWQNIVVTWSTKLSRGQKNITLYASIFCILYFSSCKLERKVNLSIIFLLTVFDVSIVMLS